MNDWELPNPYDIPVVGPWIIKSGRVIDVIGTPCAVDPVVAVKAAFHGLPVLIVSLLKPDTLDLVVDRVGTRRSKKRRMRMRVDFLIEPDIAPPKGRVGWAIWKLGGLAERVGWYMLVADATLDFAVYWTSTTWSFSGCQVPGARFANLEIEGGVFGPNGDSWSTITVWSIASQFGMDTSPFGINVPDDTVTSVILGMKTQPPPDPLTYAPNISFRLVEEATGKTANATPGRNGAGGTITGSVAIKDYFEAAYVKKYRVQYNCPEGNFRCVGSILRAYAVEDIGFESDP